MQIRISTRHGQLSDATKAKITSKVEKVLRYFDRLMAIDVTVDLEHAETPHIELLVSAEHKHDFVAREICSNGNLLGAVETVVRKVEQQIKRYKSKLLEHRGGNAHPGSPEMPLLPDQLPPEDAPDEPVAD